jgi:hypothetical protein
MQSVDLGNATATHPADHVGVATRWSPPDVFGGITLDDARRAWIAISTADATTQARADQRAAGWVGRLVAATVGIDIDAPGARAQIAAMLAEWERSGTIKKGQVWDQRARREVPVYKLATVRELRDEGV